MRKSRRPWQVRLDRMVGRLVGSAQAGEHQRREERRMTRHPRSTAAIMISIMLATIMQAIDTTIALRCRTFRAAYPRRRTRSPGS
jgi:hypothetical protein